MATGFRIKSLHFTLEIPIYCQTVLFVLGYDKKKAADIVEKMGGTPEFVQTVLNMRECGGNTNQDGDTGKFFVYLSKYPVDSWDHSILVHELFHLVEQIMDRVGMPLEYCTSSEAYAYLLGQITYDVLTKLWSANNFQTT